MAKKSQPMRVIALAASKGGVGKSTLTAALAVRAAQESSRVALIDGDPQLSLASWWDRRGGPKNPQLYDEVDSAVEAIELIASEGWEWLFIDTPPSQLDRIEAAVVCADFVLIPVKPSIFDLEAVRITEQLCQQHRKPCAFVLNMMPPAESMRPVDRKSSAEVIKALKAGGRMLLDPAISLRQSHVNAAFAGKTAAEARDATAKEEVDRLWQSIKNAVARAAKVAA